MFAVSPLHIATYSKKCSGCERQSEIGFVHVLFDNHQFGLLWRGVLAFVAVRSSTRMVPPAPVKQEQTCSNQARTVSLRAFASDVYVR